MKYAPRILRLVVCFDILLICAFAQDSNGYSPHSFCNVEASNGDKCGIAYSNPISLVLDHTSDGGTVSYDKCLWCTTTTGRFDCDLWDGKAYELGDETDTSDCSWTGCSWGGCEDDEEEVDVIQGDAAGLARDEDEVDAGQGNSVEPTCGH